MAYSCNACGRWVTSGSCDCYRPNQTPFQEDQQRIARLTRDRDRWVAAYHAEAAQLRLALSRLQRMREAIQQVLDSPANMGWDDIATLHAALEDQHDAR